MSFNINDIKQALSGGGARPSLFRVFVTNPVEAISSIKAPFLVRSAGIPEMTLGNVPVYYFGRPVNYRGDRFIQPWSVTVINDQDFAIRHGMETWNNAMNTMEGNQTQLQAVDYKSQLQVQQLAQDGTLLREYTARGAWPIQISPIRLDWQQTDTIEEFDVVFQLDTWDISAGNTGTIDVG